MKIALAAQGFINKDLDYNKDKIIRMMTGYSKKADLILFGESFMHGFECLTWDYAKDINFALLQDSDLINEIREASKEYKIGVSFGYIEKFEEKLFSSQMTIGDDGEIINNYRRVSIGWKEDPAGSQYCEGEDFIPFTYKGKTFVVGICGDFWYEDNCKRARDLDPDIILWPVYTDYNYREWNEKVKYEYAQQAKECGDRVLYVNSVCLDEDRKDIAYGGGAYFHNGEIKSEIPSGTEGVLVVDL